MERQTPDPAPQAFPAAPLDPYARRLTSGLAYLGGLLMLPLLFAYLANLRWEGLLIPVALAVAVAGFLLLCYAFQAQGYTITADDLLIHRRLWRPLRVPLAQISGISPATALADVPRRGLRFAFNAGIFGYQGPFRLAPYGEVFFLATNRTCLVAVARQERTALILSPASPRSFSEQLNQARTDRAMRLLEAPTSTPSEQK